MTINSQKPIAAVKSTSSRGTRSPAKKAAKAAKPVKTARNTVASAELESADNPGVANQSVAMSIKVLDELAAAGEPLGVSDLARRLNESKGRIHRHLSTLRALGLVSQQPVTERYGLGWKIFQLGAAANEGFGLRPIAEEHIARLRDSTNHTTVFAIPANHEALVLTSALSNNRIAILVKHGVTLKASASALGRVVVAFSPTELQQEVLATPLRQYTDASITDPAILAQHFEQIRQRYYEVAVNENMHGISTLAAPVFDEQGLIAGAVAIVGSPYTIPPTPNPALVATVQRCARDMSEALGSRSWEGINIQSL